MQITKELVKSPKSFCKIGKLPNRPSELIKIALKDLKQVEKLSNKFKVDMGIFYNNTGSKCVVCLAGSVMARSLKIKHGGHMYPSNLEECKALAAINFFRCGYLEEAFAYLDLDFPTHFKSIVNIIPYRRNKTKFKTQMAALAAALKKEGY